jgi:hypothetical protein
MCPEYQKLSSRVLEILRQIDETTARQVELFKTGAMGEFMRFDKELELLLGEKERRVGAMQQHAAEHRCHLH